MITSNSNLLRSFERKIAHDKAKHLRGWARVRLSHLAFLDPIRGEDKKITKQLERNLAKDGCHDEKYPIPAIIDDDVLQAALSVANVQPDSLKKSPLQHPLIKLRFPKGTTLEGLDGLHRQLAAKILPHAERWWTIELYGKGNFVTSYKAIY